MDPLIQLLQQFKKIIPRKEFTEHSKMLILNSPQTRPLSIFATARNILNYSGAIALTSVLFSLFSAVLLY